MGKCEVCGEYGETTKVTFGNESTGQMRNTNMCQSCAVKGAVVVKSLGGRVEVKDARSKGAAWAKTLLIMAVIGIVIYFLSR